MTILNLKTNFKNALKDLYPQPEIESFFFKLIAFKLQLQRIDLALNPEIEISKTDQLFFEDALKRLKSFEPVQYIIGTTEFFGLSFKVDKNVLIPRPETEELIVWILEEVKKKKTNQKNQKLDTDNPETTNHKPQTINILDIGTGSGCIAIALAKHLPKAEVWALDVSKEALRIARQNANLNKVNIHFLEADILNSSDITHKENVIASEAKQSQTNKEIASAAKRPRNDEQNVILSEVEGKFDIIVSNPPYVKHNEKSLMQPNVLNHEPHLALFVADNNPLIFYDKITDFTKTNLNKNGALFFEINQALGKELTDLLKQKGFKNIELRQDIFEVDRMVKGEI